MKPTAAMLARVSPSADIYRIAHRDHLRDLPRIDASCADRFRSCAHPMTGYSPRSLRKTESCISSISRARQVVAI